MLSVALVLALVPTSALAQEVAVTTAATPATTTAATPAVTTPATSATTSAATPAIPATTSPATPATTTAAAPKISAPVLSVASSTYPYLDVDGTVKTSPAANEVTAADTVWGTTGTETWYVVTGTVTLTNRVQVQGNVSLILADGCSLIASKGIDVGVGTGFTVYSQAKGTGALKATGEEYCAGIGGGKSSSAGTITINGGVISASGGSAAGIGAGVDAQKASLAVTINGGDVTATGFSNGNGIGFSIRDSMFGGSYSIVVHGGIVRASSNIESDWEGGLPREVTMDGGVVFVNRNHNDSDAYFGRYNWKLSGGILFDTTVGTGKVTGDMSLSQNLEIPAGDTLTIPSGASLTVPDGITLTNRGTIDVEGTLTINGDVVAAEGSSLTKGAGGTVTKKATSSARPTVASKTDTSVTLDVVNSTLANPIEYACVAGSGQAAPADDSTSWQASPTFTGLTKSTTYTFFVRHKGSDYYSSSTSGGLDVTTPIPAPAVAIVNQNAVAWTLSTTAAMEYSTDGGQAWMSCTASMAATSFGWVADGSTTKTVLFRYTASTSVAASGLNEPSAQQSFSIPARAAVSYTFDVSEGNVTIDKGTTSGTLKVTYGSASPQAVLDDIPAAQEITLTGTTTTNNVLVSGGVTANVTMSSCDITCGTNSPFTIGEKDGTASSVNLTLVGVNRAICIGTGLSSALPGVYVANTSTLTLTKASTGSLTAQGGTYWDSKTSICSAGIGGRNNSYWGRPSGKIVLNGGYITASSGHFFSSGGDLGTGNGIGNPEGKWNGVIDKITSTTDGNAVVCTSFSKGCDLTGFQSGVIFNDQAGTAYGSPTIIVGCETPENSTLTVEKGTTLSFGGVVTNNSAIKVLGRLIASASWTNGATGVVFEGSEGAVSGLQPDKHEGGQVASSVLKDGEQYFAYIAPETPRSCGGLLVSGPPIGIGYSYDNTTHVLTLFGVGSDVKVSNVDPTAYDTSDRIVTADSSTVNLTFDNVMIDSSSTGRSSLTLGSGSSANLSLSGTNTVKAGAEYPGILVEDGMTLTIVEGSSGSLDAEGKNGAGIGSRRDTRNEWEVPSVWYNYASGTINICGGTVRASKSTGDYGIGNGGSSGNMGTFSTGESGHAVIYASSIGDQSNKENWSGIIFEGTAGKVYGDQTAPDGFTIPKGYTLTIPSGVTLTIPANATMTNNGSIVVESGGTLKVVGDVVAGENTLTVKEGGTVIKSKNAAAPATAPELASCGDTTATFVTPTNSKPLQYAHKVAGEQSIPEARWQNGPTMSSLVASTTYEVVSRYATNDYYEASAASASTTITTLSASPTVGIVNTSASEWTLSTAASMEYSIDGGQAWTLCTASMAATSFGWVADGSTTKTVLFRYAAVGAGEVSGTQSYTIPARFAAMSVTANYATGTANTTTAMEWKLNTGTSSWQDCTDTMTLAALGQNANGSVSVLLRVKKSGDVEPSAVQELAISPTQEITHQPTTASLVFGVTTNNPSAPAYQWQKQTGEVASWTNIDGATSSTLAPTSAISGATVRCVASYSWGAALTSDSTTVPTVESTPAATIDYAAEKITGLDAGGTYLVNAVELTADSTGAIPFASTWFGTDVTIVRKATESGRANSDPQALSIPARPAAPTSFSIDNSKEGVEVPTGGEWRTKASGSSDWSEWTPAAAGGSLAHVDPSATIEVRTAAVTTSGSEAFASPAQTLAARARGATPNVTAFYATALVNTTTEMEYSTNAGAGWTPCAEQMPLAALGRSETGRVTVLIRTKAVAGSDGAYASESQSLELEAAQSFTTQPTDSSLSAAASQNSTSQTPSLKWQSLQGSASSSTWVDIPNATGDTLSALSVAGGTSVRCVATYTWDVPDGWPATSAALFTETIASDVATVPSIRTLSVDAPAFLGAAYGYAQPAAQALVISNSGNTTATIASVTVSSEDFEVSGSGESVPADGSVSTWAIQPKAGLAAGEHAAVVTVTYDGGATATANVAFTVSKAAAEQNVVTVTGYSDRYDGTAHGITASAAQPDSTLSYSKVGGADATDWSTTAPTWTDVTAAQTVYVKAANPNFEDSFGQATVTVTPAKLEVTTPSASRGYDGSALTAAGSMSGLVTGETATFSTTGSQTAVGSSANTYSIDWSGTAKKANYEVSEQLGTLTITAAAQAVPDAPTLVAATATSITLNMVAANASTGASAEYRLANGVWQASPEFSGLSANTTYSFQVRWAENGNYAASDPSTAASFSTTGYAIIQGAGQSVIVGADGTGGATFRSNAELEKYLETRVDGQHVPDEYVTTKSGSTIVTLAPAYLDTLSEGEHALEIVSQDGSASTKFTIARKASGATDEASAGSPVNPENRVAPVVSSPELQTGSPQTGDASSSSALMAVVGIVVLGCGVASVRLSRFRRRRQ
ncbi:MAG: hypothetical protein WAY93_08320 [Atopobiaceae bacterium]|jgi:hypothetical protein